MCKNICKMSIREKNKILYFGIDFEFSQFYKLNICCKFLIQKLTFPTALSQSSDKKRHRRKNIKIVQHLLVVTIASNIKVF